MKDNYFDINMKQTEIKLVLLLSLAFIYSRCQTQDCDFTNYIIPY